MLKLLMMYQAGMTMHEQNLISKALPSGFGESFERFITEGLVKPINATQKSIKKQLGKERKTQFWQGTRQEVEVPFANETKDLAPKSILPELLNQKFLWYDSYHHYEDWESQMKESYDQFNLLELPQSKDQASIYFNENQFKRRVPKGIFPDARGPRTVLRPPGT